MAKSEKRRAKSKEGGVFTVQGRELKSFPHRLGRLAGPGAHAGAGAFTLMELLIAIAILAVGLAMAGAMLPAGIVANQYSAKDLTGTMICQNGLAIARARLADGLTISTTLDDSFTNTISANDQHYLIGVDDSSGYKLLVRRVVVGQNLYQLVAVSYAKTAGGTVTLKKPKITAIDANDRTVTFNSTTYVQVGSPVVVAANGSFARILKLDGDTATLDVALRATSGDDVWVIYEAGAARSPGLTALGTITPLN